jgi:hypothetical protein
MIGRMIGRLRRVRWWPDSLRFRLLAGAAVWITLALTIAGFVLSGLFQDRIHQRFQDEMLNHLEQLAASPCASL